MSEAHIRCNQFFEPRGTKLWLRCSNLGKVIIEGRHYCTAHNPLTIRKRKEAALNVAESRRADARLAVENETIGAALRRTFRDDMEMWAILQWIRVERGVK